MTRKFSTYAVAIAASIGLGFSMLVLALTGSHPTVTCTTSDNTFPCAVTPDPSVADGVLTAKVKLRHE